MAKHQKAKTNKSDERKHHGGNTTRHSFVRFGDGSSYPVGPWKVTSNAWTGASIIKEPFDAKQAELNRLAGFC